MVIELSTSITSYEAVAWIYVPGGREARCGKLGEDSVECRTSATGDSIEQPLCAVGHGKVYIVL